jgi:hypothetical protein
MLAGTELEVFSVVQVEQPFNFQVETLEFMFPVPTYLLNHCPTKNFEAQFLDHWQNASLNIKIKAAMNDNMHYYQFIFVTNRPEAFRRTVMGRVIASAILLAHDNDEWRKPIKEFPTFPAILTGVGYDQCLESCAEKGGNYYRALTFQDCRKQMEEFCEEELLPRIWNWYEECECQKWLDEMSLNCITPNVSNRPPNGASSEVDLTWLAR